MALGAAERINLGHERFSSLAVGDIVSVRRYGRDYRAKVVSVGNRGAVKASFRYGNGSMRTVSVTWHDCIPS